MSTQANTWVRHTLKYLGASDEHLADLFLQAMTRAGYPGVSAADAVEAICADFLAGAPLPEIHDSMGPEEAPGHAG